MELHEKKGPSKVDLSSIHDYLHKDYPVTLGNY